MLEIWVCFDDLSKRARDKLLKRIKAGALFSADDGGNYFRFEQLSRPAPRSLARRPRATMGFMRCNKKKDPQCGGPSEIGCLLNQAATTDAFCFLRQPSSAKAPRPVAKSGRVPGTGMAATSAVNTKSTGLEPALLT